MGWGINEYPQNVKDSGEKQITKNNNKITPSNAISSDTAKEDVSISSTFNYLPKNLSIPSSSNNNNLISNSSSIPGCSYSKFKTERETVPSIPSTTPTTTTSAIQFSPPAPLYYDKKSFSACRYQQQQSVLQQRQTPTISPNSIGLGTVHSSNGEILTPFASDNTISNRYNNSFLGTGNTAFPYSAENITAQHHLTNSLFNQNYNVTTAAAVCPSFTPNFAAASLASLHDSSLPIRSCALPSPTIYPPTPPPSAPWIHPWYSGDSF